MAYLVCSHCGGKALAVSTRCPRCQTPFPRVVERAPPAPKSLRVPLLIGGAILFSIAGGYTLWRLQNGRHVDTLRIPAVTAKIEETVDSTGNASRAALDSPTVIPAAGQTASNPTAPPPTVPVAPTATVAAISPSVSVSGDSVHWEHAVVRSDVNLRKTASRDGESIRVLRIDQPVELGAFQEGWRQVRLGTVIGWADPRHFEIVARKR